MSGYFSGLVNSAKGLLGFENLEVVQPGPNNQTDEKEKENANMTEQKQSLWKQLSSYIGKDITSMISLPVWIFEPLSFLQIMCEPMQFAELLEKASTSPDPHERMAYLCAWVMAGYNCAVRNKKPFNPLLGETFEYISEERKYRFFAEQVSHHPPVGVAIATSDDYTLELEMELKTKFRGNSSDVFVHGQNQFRTSKYQDHFSWGHLETCAHNVIIGSMWVDHYGEIQLVNHTTGDKCILKATKCGWLGSGRYEVNADIFDKQGKLRMKVHGKWTEGLYTTKVTKEGEAPAKPMELWKRAKQPLNKWNWPKFNETMNAMNEEYQATLPPRDSRFRTDRLNLEQDNQDVAGKEKHRLEEKQRSERKEREAKGIKWEPKYFKQQEHATFGHLYIYTGNYWEERKATIQEYQNKKKAEGSPQITEKDPKSEEAPKTQ